MALYKHGSTSKPPSRTGMSEFDILKAAHRFLRDEEDTKDLSWEDQLAVKYYASLYREFAVCDLKHYKSGNFALRWRTEDEVLSGAGETTCGNTRCDYNSSQPNQPSQSSAMPPLTTLELPFAYVEHGENMSALVKVVLCPKCVDKLMYKRRKERGNAVEQEEKHLSRAQNSKMEGSGEQPKTKEIQHRSAEEHSIRKMHLNQQEGSGNRGRDSTRRKRSSRSRSPTRGTSHLKRARHREGSP